MSKQRYFLDESGLDDLRCQVKTLQFKLDMANEREKIAAHLLEEAEARIKVFTDCMHRALKIYQEKHPNSNIWPDGAENFAWLLEEYDELVKSYNAFTDAMGDMLKNSDKRAMEWINKYHDLLEDYEELESVTKSAAGLIKFLMGVEL